MAARRKSAKRKRTAQAPYKQYGFSSDKAYRNWLKTHSKLPESNPLYFRNTIRGNRRKIEIERIKSMQRRSGSPSKLFIRKMNAIVYEKETMSPFNFLDRYLDQMKALLANSGTSQRDKAALRKAIKQLDAEVGDVNDEIEIGKQLQLFR